ncbi:MAG: hypothetical protein GY811_22540 [Myxococcales bacterium]|nr:hypothetical protein [Myxococcales bacterium]
MEGISDGRAVDSCYFCALLYPDLEPCPECQNRFHYRPARMLEADSAERELMAAIARYQQAPNIETTTQLLTLWHEVGELAVTILASANVHLCELRKHFTQQSVPELESE